MYAPAIVFSAGIARFDDCAFEYSKGAISARAVALRYTRACGCRISDGDVSAQWIAPATASWSGTIFARLTPGVRGFIMNGCCESTSASGTSASSERHIPKNAAFPSR